MTLSHTNERGEATMVDVTDKHVTDRLATARAVVRLKPDTLALILEGGIPKGDVLAVARIAGIQAAKRTSDLIPLCHPLPIGKAAVEFEATGKDELTITGTCRVSGRTGVEMEALTAVSVAALTVYDMCKAVERGITIESVALVEKTGGKSGDYRR